MADDSWNYVDGIRCPHCQGKIRRYFDFDVCDVCNYVFPTRVDSSLFRIKSDGISTAYGKLEEFMKPFTLKIDCEEIRLFQKGLDIEFDIDPKKLENINVIEINGYKFIKEK